MNGIIFGGEGKMVVRQDHIKHMLIIRFLEVRNTLRPVFKCIIFIYATVSGFHVFCIRLKLDL